MKIKIKRIINKQIKKLILWTNKRVKNHILTNEIAEVGYISAKAKRIFRLSIYFFDVRTRPEKREQNFNLRE